MSVVLAEDLSKRYGRRIGISHLNLSIEAGSVFGFLGPNGAGKTTTIRLLMGLLRPDEGSMRVFGADCWRQGHLARRDVGYLPGDLRMYPWLTCRKAVRIWGQTRGEDLSTAGSELAEDFRLEADVPVRRMSHGTRQKLGLILALVHRPKLVVLDEPTAALDPLVQDTLFRRLRALARDGHTIFFSTHVLSEVEDLCGRVGIVRDGCLVEDAEVEALRSRAGRHVNIVFRAGVDSESLRPPDFLRELQRDPRQWRAIITGESRPLIEWCAAQPVADVSVGQPDLADVFRKYYAKAEASA